MICSADLRGDRRRRQRRVARARAGARDRQRTRYSDTMPAGAIAEADAPPAAMGVAARRSRRCPAGCTRWLDALDERLAPAAHRAGPDDLAVLPYTSGTDRPAQGLHAHAHAADAQRRRRPHWRGAGRTEAVVLGVLPMFHVTGMQYSVIALGLHRAATVVVHAALGPRLRRAADPARTRHALGLHPHHGDRPLSAARTQGAIDLSACAYIGGGGAAMPEAVAQRLREVIRPAVRRGLRPDRDRGADRTPTRRERAKQQCLGIPIFTSIRASSIPNTLQEAATGRGRRDHHPRPDGLHGLLEAARGDCAGLLRRFDGKRFFRTGDLGRCDEEGYFFITDRLKRMINARATRSGRPRSKRCCTRIPRSRRPASSPRATPTAARP